MAIAGLCLWVSCFAFAFSRLVIVDLIRNFAVEPKIMKPLEVAEIILWKMTSMLEFAATGLLLYVPSIEMCHRIGAPEPFDGACGLLLTRYQFWMMEFAKEARRQANLV